MKKRYIIPVTELVVVNLQDSLMENMPYDPDSNVGTGMGNENVVDIEDDVNDVPTSHSLWDE